MPSDKELLNFHNLWKGNDLWKSFVTRKPNENARQIISELVLKY